MPKSVRQIDENVNPNFLFPFHSFSFFDENFIKLHVYCCDGEPVRVAVTSVACAKTAQATAVIN